MKLILGLGNPGDKYEKNRHNAGFMFLDFIRDEWNFPEFSLEKNFRARIAEKTIDGEKIILAKPETFMNLSGESARAIMDFYKIPPEDIIVAHDDLDIEIGKYKISKDSGHAGHNGVESIIRHAGTQAFKRIRIGIEKEGGRENRTDPGDEFVLKDFTQEEVEIISSIFPEILKALLQK